MKSIYINAIARYSEQWDMKTIIPDANMRRRMSRMVKMGVSAGLKCLEIAEISCPDAIITASGFGCLADSEKFLNALITNNEQQLPPTPFIQSTFNTIGSQIAILTNCLNYNMTYVNGLYSFDSALFDSFLTIGDDAKSVLVGIADEATPTLHTIFKRLNIADDTAPCDGAVFLLLSDTYTRNSVAEISNFQLTTSAPPKYTKGSFPTDRAFELYNCIEQHKNAEMQFDNFKFDLKCL